MTEVITIVPVTAIPYAAASRDEAPKLITSARQPMASR